MKIIKNSLCCRILLSSTKEIVIPHCRLDSKQHDKTSEACIHDKTKPTEKKRIENAAIQTSSMLPHSPQTNKTYLNQALRKRLKLDKRSDVKHLPSPFFPPPCGDKDIFTTLLASPTPRLKLSTFLVTKVLFFLSTTILRKVDEARQGQPMGGKTRVKSEIQNLYFRWDLNG